MARRCGASCRRCSAGRATPATTRRARSTRCVAAAPDLKRKFTLASVKATLPVLLPRGPHQPFGFQNLQQWQAYGDWMRRNNLLTRPADAGDGR